MALFTKDVLRMGAGMDEGKKGGQMAKYVLFVCLMCVAHLDIRSFIKSVISLKLSEEPHGSLRSTFADPI